MSRCGQISTRAKNSLIIRDWANNYMRDSMFQKVIENLKSKDAHEDGICSEYSFDGGKLWMEGKLCVPDAQASRLLNWWHEWDSHHAHGCRLCSKNKHRLFPPRLYTRCMKVLRKVAVGYAQCSV